MGVGQAFDGVELARSGKVFRLIDDPVGSRTKDLGEFDSSVIDLSTNESEARGGETGSGHAVDGVELRR